MRRQAFPSLLYSILQPSRPLHITSSHFLHPPPPLVRQPVDTADVGNSAAGSPPLVMGRELVGDQDDVLDLVSIPNTIRGSLEGQEGVQGEESQAAHQFAVATNSTQVRLMSVSTFCCSSLAGHTDVVLGLDVSPDG